MGEVRLSETELFFVPPGFDTPTREEFDRASLIADPLYLAMLKESYLNGITDVGGQPTNEDLRVACDDAALLEMVAKNRTQSEGEHSIPTARDTVPYAFERYLGQAGLIVAKPEDPYAGIRVIFG